MASCSASSWRVCEADQAEIAASISLSQASHVHSKWRRIQPQSNKNLAQVCCNEEQPFEGTALFSRKKEKEVSRNCKLCLYVHCTLQSEWHFLFIGKHVSTDSMQHLTTEEVIFAFMHSCINSCLTLRYSEQKTKHIWAVRLLTVHLDRKYTRALHQKRTMHKECRRNSETSTSEMCLFTFINTVEDPEISDAVFLCIWLNTFN